MDSGAPPRLLEIAAQIVTDYSDILFEPLSGLFKAQVGYATPRVDVRGAVFTTHFAR
jgi:hypothetical protein